MLIKIKSFTRRVANILEFIIGFFDVNSKQIPKKTDKSKVLGIIKLDAIGDYILFRNFLSSIIRSNKYKEFEIVFIGNKIYKGFAEEMDGHLVKEYVWIDINLLWKNSRYRKTQINLINKIHFDCIFQPTFSRRYYVDKMIKHINSKEKIGVVGDNRNTISVLNKISEHFYTQLIRIKDPGFEFHRNKYIVSEFLNEEINIQRPAIEMREKSKFPKTILIFPEASVSYKIWPDKKFAEIIRFFSVEKGYSIMLGGIDSEKAERISTLSKGIKINNMVGKTNLYNLTQLIASVDLLISNDTVAVHMAVAVDTPVLCIYNGKNYGTFVPYPKGVYDKLKTVTPNRGYNINKIETREVVETALELIS